MRIRFSPTRLSLRGSGSALPGKLVDNQELLAALALHCGPSLAKLGQKYVHRLGIRSRHLSRSLQTPLSATIPGNSAPELCYRAVRQAHTATATDSAGIDFLIGHTATPHTLLPPNISWVAEELHYEGPYMELRQACTGFANALTVAAAMIAEDPTMKVGIVGSETGSPFFEFSNDFIDREQLVNCVQMGDGAGAAIVARAEDDDEQLISDIYCGHIGLDETPGISIEGGGSAQPATTTSGPFFRHRAKSVRKSGERLLLAGVEAMRERGHVLGDFDWVLPHQVNGHIGELFAARYPEVRGKVFVTADTLGNLGSAAIWVSLDQLRRSGKLERGQRVLVLGAEASKFMVGGFIYTH
jgi:3-oxoacyl-[acyl-carrier-protein] synthase-3